MSLHRILCWRLRGAACALLAAAGSLACLPSSAAGQKCTAGNWPLWESWASRYVQDDGRVLESSMKQNHSTSEGQAYGMLFALIGNDPARFEHLWTWTVANMLGSDPATRLPGWLWGQGKDGQWQLQDANSASDADLWIAYALLEASRLWQRPDYRKDALRLLATIKAKLVVDLPGLGMMVLPGAEGFVQRNVLWTLNPSYLPLPLLRRLAKEEPAGPWKQVADNTVRMIQDSSPKGYAADWVGYRMTGSQTGQFVVAPGKGEIGSYDAIRVYLWAGMTPARDPGFAPLLAALDGMGQATASTGVPPEKVQVSSGVLEGSAPFGFSAALVPYFVAKGDLRLAEQLQRRARENIDAAFAPGSQRAEALYYNVMLSLFGLGWTEKRYQFRDDGTLKLSWERSCARTVPR
ncbi:cellulose synthase complex periplasmic endoglucanase BcsZ [Herbaspirillum sp. RV1423]|uniref:cellulose synthase complex periplasmic endoglucanase BcsZ n=1 Tax=Herbaspirillum sp. RV1423 TaxID=1443993 RepID=UPI0004B1C4FB|nr:cellulose synthase complex periplasmic endoglucanase BcsZ [Herbaspirillum sp. RV1423]